MNHPRPSADSPRASADGTPLFEQLLLKLAARFVGADSGNIDGMLADSLRQVVEALDLDRSTLWQIGPDGTGVCTHSWTRPLFPPVQHGMIASEHMPWLETQIRSGRTISCASPDQLPQAIERTSLASPGTKSTVIVPVPLQAKTLAAMSFSTQRIEREWDDVVVGQLQEAAAVFAQGLASKHASEELRRALAEVRQLRAGLTAQTGLRGYAKTAAPARRIVAESAAARRALEQVRSVAPTSASVLLLGETGSGKEVFAEAIHELSLRADRPLVRVNCSAIPPALLESELFGREKGAYTGALSRQIGRFELAHQGTIFLDEIGELPLEAQVKLLRAIDDKVIERLGSPTPIRIDVRIIAATNRNIERAAREHTFREDLLYRLNVFPIEVPPLRERAEDFPLLLWTFVEEFSRALGKRIDTICRDSLAVLQDYEWRGNVRELRNVVERAVILATGPTLVVEPPRALSAGLHPPDDSPHRDAGTARLDQVEVAHIRSVLERVQWRVRGRGGAAETLGLKPTTLESRMARLGIQRPGQRVARGT